MKPHSTILIAVLALAGSALTLTAQDAGGGPPPGDRPPRQERPDGGQRPPPPPIIAALDANHDGVIDEQEIANASAALKKLDKNGDGKLTMDELRPPRPEGGGPGAPGGQGFRGPRGEQQGGQGQRPQRPPADQ
jgi:hypothetical protein